MLDMVEALQTRGRVVHVRISRVVRGRMMMHATKRA